jgi:hypothetical protein
MEKLDRLGWAVGISMVAYGVRFGVRTNDPRILARLRQHFPFGSKPAASPVVEKLYSLIVGGESCARGVRRFNVLYGDHERIARSADLEDVLEAFDSDLQLCVAEAARRRVFVHAGVVGWKGCAILVPGRSNTGKSTLVARLVQAGATYYSDEYAVLDIRGRVHPYPKPLSIREHGNGKRTKYPVEVLGGAAGSRPLPVSLVVSAAYKPGARWRPRMVSAGKGMLLLLKNALAARREPERVLVALRQVVEEAEVLEGARGEAAEIVEGLLAAAERAREGVPKGYQERNLRSTGGPKK